jgi:tetratricopeptide (TPR) repeat protein
MFWQSTHDRARIAVSGADRARDAKQWRIAARLYDKALRRYRLNPPIWVQYGHALKESGRLAEAETAYRTAIAQDPSSGDAHLQLGHVLKLQGRTAEAEGIYLLAAVIDPDMPEPLRELRGLGWPEPAVPELRQHAKTGVAPSRAPEPGDPGSADAESSDSPAEVDRLPDALDRVEPRILEAKTAAAKMQIEIATLRDELSRMLTDSAAGAAGPTPRE